MTRKVEMLRTSGSAVPSVRSQRPREVITVDQSGNEVRRVTSLDLAESVLKRRGIELQLSLEYFWHRRLCAGNGHSPCVEGAHVTYGTAERAMRSGRAPRCRACAATASSLARGMAVVGRSCPGVYGACPRRAKLKTSKSTLCRSCDNKRRADLVPNDVLQARLKVMRARASQSIKAMPAAERKKRMRAALSKPPTFETLSKAAKARMSRLSPDKLKKQMRTLNAAAAVAVRSMSQDQKDARMIKARAALAAKGGKK